ncbi:MAG: four helix bundle protein [Fimbriimonas sp.]
MPTSLGSQRQDLRGRTKRFALDSIYFVQELPHHMVGNVLGKQYLRCATSVGANYRAAYLAKSEADMIAKLKIVEEEADECGYWLELLAESGATSKDRIAPLAKEADEILRMMVASIKTLRSRNPVPRR